MTEEETIEIETTPIDEGAAVALSSVERAAIDSQIATAKQYPRSVDKCMKDAMTLACMDEDTAASCFYALPRSGKTIEGPSARLAEIMVSCWGNIRVDADIVGEDRTHITAVGTCFDVEKNVAVRVRVRRRITSSNGRRYNDDMIGVTGNAAISIALRNCVFKVIPHALTTRVYMAARKASVGKGGTITQKRQKALEWFSKLGVTEAQVFAQLGVRGLDDIGEDQLITLRGMVTAIQSGDASVESMFRKHDVSEGSDELNESLGKKKADPTKPDLEEMYENIAKPGIRENLLTKDERVKQCETHFEMMNTPKDTWLGVAEDYTTVPKDAKTLKGLSVDSLIELEIALAKEVGGTSG